MKEIDQKTNPSQLSIARLRRNISCAKIQSESTYASAKPDRGSRLVGVAGDEKSRNFFHEMSWEENPWVFRPLLQDTTTRSTLIVGTAGDPGALSTILEKRIAKIDPNVPLETLKTMQNSVTQALAYPLFRAFLLSIFAGLALLLAAARLYFVLSQWVVQQTKDIGIRMALGGAKSDVVN